jgi:hypothetical protein
LSDARASPAIFAVETFKRGCHLSRVIWIAVAVVVLLAGVFVLVRATRPFEVVYDEAAVRYQLDIVISGDGGTVTSSGVMQSTFVLGSTLNGPTIITRQRGQAIPIQITKDRRLYALHIHPYALGQSSALIDDACGVSKSLPQPHSDSEWLQAVLKEKGPCSAPSTSLPLMVAFKDPNDAHSIYRVYPEDLAAIAGYPVDLRATVTVTNAPITAGIEAELPFLRNLPVKGFEISVRESEAGKLTLSGEAISTEVVR